MEGCTLIELATLISVVRLEDNAYGWLPFMPRWVDWNDDGGSP